MEKDNGKFSEQPSISNSVHDSEQAKHPKKAQLVD
jgi:hypothetical protein